MMPPGAAMLEMIRHYAGELGPVGDTQALAHGWAMASGRPCSSGEQQPHSSALGVEKERELPGVGFGAHEAAGRRFASLQRPSFRRPARASGSLPASSCSRQRTSPTVIFYRQEARETGRPAAQSSVQARPHTEGQQR